MKRQLLVWPILGLCVLAGAATASADPFSNTGHRNTDLGDQEMDACLASPGLEDITGFTHQPTVFVGGRFWYFMAPEHELNVTQAGQPQDLPGHCWRVSPNSDGQQRYIGKHFNTGPVAAGGPAKFWSSDAGEHEQLYWVDLVISPWTPEIAEKRARQGYVHYHELVLKDDGCLHPRLVTWMRHSAVSAFTLDGGPPRFREDGRPFRARNVAHTTPGGLDLNFMPNYDIPYLPELICGIE